MGKRWEKDGIGFKETTARDHQRKGAEKAQEKRRIKQDRKKSKKVF